MWPCLLTVALTALVTLYVTYLFQSGKKIAFDLSESEASNESFPGIPEPVESYTVVVEGFVGWLDVTFSGMGGSDSPVRRR